MSIHGIEVLAWPIWRALLTTIGHWPALAAASGTYYQTKTQFQVTLLVHRPGRVIVDYQPAVADFAKDEREIAGHRFALTLEIPLSEHQGCRIRAA